MSSKSTRCAGLDSEGLVKQYLPLVKQMARRYARLRPDLLEDLSQVGSIGLLKAIKYYNPHRRKVASFATVASHYVRGEIRHYLRDHCSLVQVPRKLGEMNRQLAKLDQTLSKELEREPTVQELSERSGYSVEQICEAQQSVQSCVYYQSLESREEGEKEEGRTVGEAVPDCKYQDFVLAAEDRELVTSALKALGEKTRQIVEFVYFYDLSQKETAQKLGISEMGVSRAIQGGVKKLRDILNQEIF